MTHLSGPWKWLAALAVVAGVTAALLMSDFPTAPALALAAELVQSFWGWLASTFGSYGSTAALAAQAIVLVLVLWFGTKLAIRVIRARFLDRTRLDEGRKFALERIITYSMFTFGAVAGIEAIGVDLGSIAVFSGALGIGLGLGFQTIAKDFASGLILLFERPVKVGDRVQVGELQGNIVTIGSRATWVRTNDNVVMIVPNSEFIERRVTNLTLIDRNVRITVPVGVSYASDPEQVRSLLLEAARGHPDVLQELSPDVIFAGFGDSSLDFELRVWTSRQVTTPRVIASELYFQIFAALKSAGIEIPFPQRDLHVRSLPGAGRELLI